MAPLITATPAKANRTPHKASRSSDDTFREPAAGRENIMNANASTWGRCWHRIVAYYDTFVSTFITKFAPARYLN